MSFRVIALFAILALPFVESASSAAGREIVSFPFRDAEYLLADQSKGGLAYVPGEVGRGEEVPLVVFLHGVNPTSVVHSWVGGAATPDLTAFAESLVSHGKTAPFILAAPSATRRAMAGRLMWPD